MSKLTDAIRARIADNPEAKRGRIARRAASRNKAELLDYIDQAHAGIGLALKDYRKSDDTASLKEIRDGLLTLDVIAEELIIRCELEER